MKKSSFLVLTVTVLIIATVSTVLMACDSNNIQSVKDDENFVIPVPGDNMYETVDCELPPESFVGTLIEEDTHYMVVEPNFDEEEYNISKTIRIEYLHDHIDYLYGTGRKVVITYIPPLIEGKTIFTDDIRHDGFEKFQLSVQYAGGVLPPFDAMPYTDRYITLVANNNDFDDNSSNYNLYYLGLYDVYVTVDGNTLPLKEALTYGKVTLDGIIAECMRLKSIGEIQSEEYKDGGSVLFDFGDFKILKYHTLDGNRDLYIGTPDLNINAVNATSLCIKGYEWKDWGIRLKTYNISPDGATIVFVQNGGDVTGKLQTGDAFYLEKKEGNKWISVNTKPLIDYAFYSVAYGIKKDSKSELKTEWAWLYDSLPDGEYRIVKDVMDFRKTADYDKQVYHAYFKINNKTEE